MIAGTGFEIITRGLTSRRERMKIGYARISTHEQSLSLQIDALEAAGCAQIFTDEGISGACISRPALDEAVAALQSGDCLITWKLDRLGRSLAHLIQLTGELGARDVGFRSLSESIDTTTAGGRLYFHMMGALAEFERSLISERTRAGMEAARRRGAIIGRPSKLAGWQIEYAARRLATEDTTIAVLANEFGVAPLTLSRALKRRRATSADPERAALAGCQD